MFPALLSLLFGLKVLSLVPYHNSYLWELQIVVLEIGHLVSFALLLCGFLYFAFKEKTFATWVVFIFCLFTAGLYGVPVYLAWNGVAEYKEILKKEFGPEPVGVDFGLSLTKLLQIETTEISFLRDRYPVPRRDVYWRDEKTHYELDLLNYHASAPEGSKPAPWVIIVHGGGWEGGDAGQLGSLNYEMENWGFAVFSINYRLAPSFMWPAPLEDVTNAAKWIQLNARDLGVDPTRGFIIGRSAGGQVALSSCYSKRIANIRGCVGFYSPADLEYAYNSSLPDDPYMPIPRLTRYLGGSLPEKPTIYHAASALFSADHTSPPTLLLHGTPDVWVGIKHSHELLDKLQENHVHAALIEFPWATHGFDVNLDGPAGQLSTQAVHWFLLNESK